MDQLRIIVLFGGRSGEHEVSLRSAESIIAGLQEQDRFTVLPVGISRDGTWFYGNNPLQALSSGALPGGNVRVAILPDPAVRGLYILEGRDAGNTIPADVVFPVLHGTYGEDGTLQGLLELARLPYVGAGVAGSAVGMDKILMKSVLIQGGVPVGEYLWFTVTDWQQRERQLKMQIEIKLGFPCFVKPANLGSSIGINKVYDRAGLAKAVLEASRYDRRILVEKYLEGREIECSVLGNDNPQASLPGEIIPCNEFYDYTAKYVDERSRLVIPAQLPEKLTEEIKRLAIQTFSLLDCAGLGRVDFFANERTGQVWVNELNTLPGFTVISMYPKLWEASGLPINSLLAGLVDLALERFAAKEQMETVYRP